MNCDDITDPPTLCVPQALRIVLAAEFVRAGREVASFGPTAGYVRIDWIAASSSLSPPYSSYREPNTSPATALKEIKSRFVR